MRPSGLRLLCVSFAISLSSNALLRAQATAEPPTEAFIRAVAQQAGFIDAFVTYCAKANRAGVANDAVQLQGWEQRNHWQQVKPKITADPALQKLMADALAAERAELEAHAFKSAFACAALTQELRSTTHDPSLTYREAANAIGAEPPPAAAPTAPLATATAPATQPPNQSPPPVQAAPAPAANASASAPVISTGGSITVGSMTVTPPPGWTIQKSTPESALLKIQTQHNTGVILLSVQPLNGSLGESLVSAIRANFPGTGLTFKYPHTGVTGGGSPAMYILDSGKLNRQYEDIAAVGIAIGGRLQMALLISSQWGGEEIKFRGQLDAMIAAAVLHGETGGTWDPLHPPPARGGRSGLFFGSGLMNQLNPLGGMDLIARREYVLLLPSGQAYYGLPEGGHVLDLDFPTACQKMPKRCGTYSIENGQIQFIERDSYGLVTHVSSTFTPGAPGHSIIADYHGTKAFEVLPVHDRKLAGKYTSTFAQTGNIGQSTSVVAQTFITFSPDGRYQKSGFSSASFQGPSAGGTTMSNRGLVSGQYRFEGYTMTLSPSNGAPELYTVVFENQDPSPKAIFINDKAFLKDGN
jgi:hypothetical protein